MSEPSLALQKAIRARLSATGAVTALVPAANVLDRSARPERFPAVIVGEGQSLFADHFETFHDRAHADLHVWTQEPGTEAAKTIVGAIRAALLDGPMTADGYAVREMTMTARYPRDPSGNYAHAVVGIDAAMVK